MKSIDSYWDGINPVSIALLPLSWLFCLLAWLRRSAYRFGLFKTIRVSVPVIVIGNISVGGVGKTPLVIWLSNYLKDQGLRPGIISRGYGGESEQWPRQVSRDSDPALVGDEPVLIARRTGCPVWVGPDRVEAARALVEAGGCDIILSDDGMQHYALGRDLEIAVIDGSRRLGNGFCLPAGPLRERAWRLDRVDLVVVNGEGRENEVAMGLRPTAVVNVNDSGRRIELANYRGASVHGIAGIGNPARFFDSLHNQGVKVVEHGFPDHHRFAPGDIQFSDDLPVLMTEKDAVKCIGFADERHWYVEVDADPDEVFVKRLDHLLRGLKDG
ncbi:MAG: tetraacyldisaccharide 4'-kinase [Candidatus Sedimenticola sp. PURPLELP]